MIKLLILCVMVVSVWSKLVQVQMFIRHGDRTPVFWMDSYRQKWNCTGDGCYGQLTEIGKRAQYLLGQEMRRRYVNEMKFVQNLQDVKVISTNYTRTIQSANLLLSGMFQGSVAQVQPEICNYLYVLHQGLDEIKESIYKQENWTIFIERYKSFKMDLYKKFNVSDFPWIAFHDVFLTHSLHNFPLPVNDHVVNRVREAAEMEWLLYISNKDYLLVGIEKMLKRIRNELMGSEKFVLYSGHDTTISPLLQFFGLYDGKFPEYSANIILEVHEGEMGTKWSRLLYNMKELRVWEDQVFQKVFDIV